MRRLGAMTVAAICAVGVPGCGGERESRSPAEDRKQIEAVYIRSITVSSPKVDCRETVTPEFVTRYYLTHANCRRASRGSDVATGAEVTVTSLDGDFAKATVVAGGPGFKDVRGTIKFARAGAVWKIHDWGADYMRSLLTAGVAGVRELPRSVSRCVGRQLNRLSGHQVRAIVRATLRGNTAPREWPALYEQCVRRDAAGVRRRLEPRLRRMLQADPQLKPIADCFLRRMRETPIDHLLDAFKLEQAAKAAAGACIAQNAQKNLG